MTLPEKTVAVLGATGFIGTNLVKTLLVAGWKVRAVVRDPSKAKLILPPGTQFVQGTLNDADGLADALEGSAAVINLVGIIRGRAEDFEAVHREGTKNLLGAARRAGDLTFFIYVSANGADPGAANPYLRTKGQAEDAVRMSGLPYLILRPTLVMGKGDGFTTPLLKVLRGVPIVPIIGSGTYPLRPVAVRDLATIITQATDGHVNNRTFTVAGPEEVSYETLVRLLLEIMGNPKPLVHIPLPLATLGVRLTELFTPNPILTGLQLAMLLAGSTGDPGPVTEAFNVVLTPLREALAEILL